MNISECWYNEEWSYDHKMSIITSWNIEKHICSCSQNERFLNNKKTWGKLEGNLLLSFLLLICYFMYNN